MAKWSLTDAATTRIEKRIDELRTDDQKNWHLDPMSLLLEAMRPEKYARSQKAAEEIVTYWIREGKQTWLCSAIFHSYASQCQDLREAGGNIMSGIRAFGRMKL